MSEIKSYTDLEQSKKLAEILPIESADMCCFQNQNECVSCYAFPFSQGNKAANPIPCWSLAALLDILDYPQLSKDKLGSGKVGWMVSVYPNDCRYDSCWHDNPVDACVAMVEKLHELKIL